MAGRWASTGEPARGLPSRPIVVVSLTVALTLLGDSMLYAVLPAQYDAFGLPVVAVGVLLSVNRYVRLLTNPLAGRLCDRVGLRWPFLGAVLAGALATVVYGLAPGLAVFAAARLLWGGCWSLLRLGGYLTVLHHSPPTRLARGLGIYGAVSRTGSLAGMLAGGILADSLGARPALILFGAVTLLALPLASSVPLDWGRAPEAASDRRPEAPAPSRLSFLFGTEPGKARPQAATVHLAALWVGLAAGVVTSSLGLLFRVRFGERVDVLGLALGIATLTGTVLASRWVIDLPLVPLFGVLTDRVGRRLAGLGFAAVAVGGLALLATGAGLGPIVAGVVLAFAGCSALVVVLESSAGTLASRVDRAAAMSRYATWADVGSASGPALGYALVGTLGLPAIYGLIALGLIVVMAGFFVAAPPALRPASQPSGS